VAKCRDVPDSEVLYLRSGTRRDVHETACRTSRLKSRSGNQF
jgi:hypothetical protein